MTDIPENAEQIDLTELFLSANPTTAKDLVEFFASAMDAMLQTYQDSVCLDGTEEERLGARAVAATRVAQMARHTYEVFSLGAEAMSYGSDADTKACNAAAEVVSLMTIKHLRKLADKSKLPPKPDGALN